MQIQNLRGVMLLILWEKSDHSEDTHVQEDSRSKTQTVELSHETRTPVFLESIKSIGSIPF
ncbi:hypothetical protein PROFUN_03936 [Planoprotostelium fungivorum]|uniref:Uncharacterized protein n=1 Tax=Planoprotostelium fungivorum TaxID=1890364 RepID=A0A2P6MTR1_9EUKA|nr:hypothetical protein PROFUN_03936 [Planoprotostelium fungivorum]